MTLAGHVRISPPLPFLAPGEGARWIAGFERRYAVTTYARVASFSSGTGFPRWLKARPHDRTETPPRLRVILHRDGEERPVALDRLVLLTFARPPRSWSQVPVHKDGSDSCALANLRWGSRGEALRARLLGGTLDPNRRAPRCAASPAEIRRAFKRVGGSAARVARCLGVSARTIRRYRSRRSGAWATERMRNEARGTEGLTQCQSNAAVEGGQVSGRDRVTLRRVPSGIERGRGAKTV